ncbi:MAG: bacillithiol synthase [Acidobacteriaceae bacterium]|nr:bacillithiol synthase [Acidobacteriaceae bacterium]
MEALAQKEQTVEDREAGDAVESECYPSSVLPHSSRLFLDYVESSAPLAPFYSHVATGKAWMRQGRPLTPEHRSQLADLLTEQNRRFGGGAITDTSIDRLRNGASAVVTGQQVALFGGPLYTLLKAATAIARAREATAAGIETVPVFWLASEDHDFAEVATIHLPAQTPHETALKTITIGPPPQVPVPVGGIPLGPGVKGALDEVEALLGADTTALLRETYPAGDATMAEAFGSLMARLFAPWGLIVMDAAGAPFHQLGAPVLEQAIRDADALHAALVARDRELAARGYHSQVLVGEQSSLLFLIDEATGARLPLRRSEGRWKAGSRRCTSEELLHVLEVSPERLSPNALLRPVFQDAILPTSAYVAGPAEIAYFAQSNVVFSAILGRETAVLPRLSATLVNPRLATVMARFQVRFPDALTTPDTLAQRLGARSLPIEGKRRLASAGNALDEELTALTGWMAQMDAGLGRSAETAASKMRYQMNRLRRLAARHQLEKESSLARHAAAITGAIYPDGHLQERVVAGIAFLASHGEGLLEHLVEAARDACPGHKMLLL